MAIMINSIREPIYSTLVIFGKEGEKSILSPSRFLRIADILYSVLNVRVEQVKCRGRIEREGKNIAPRTSRFSPQLLTKWSEQLNGDTFMNFEIYDAEWKNNQHPKVYAAITKFWEYDTEGYSERTKVGAENCITIAVDISELSIPGAVFFESVAQRLMNELNIMYGFIEVDVGWDRQIGNGPLRGHMIDLRWYDLTSVDYRRGKYNMDAVIPRLYMANFLSRNHFKRAGDCSSLLPEWTVCLCEKWSNDLFFIKFAEDPQQNDDFYNEVKQYFNLI